MVELIKDLEIMKMTVEELTIEELADEIEKLKWEKGFYTFKIVEEFSKCGYISYIVNGLTIETEDDIVCCSDNDNVIVSNRGVMMMFLKDSLLSAHKFIINGFIKDEIEFVDGLVTIEIN